MTQSIAAPPPARQERELLLGAELSAVEARLAEWIVEDDGSRAVLLDYATPPIPPALLAPAYRGEPVRADLMWPPHPRGTGQPWPPEARISDGEMGGRMPLAYAWLMLARGQSWRWERGVPRMRVAPRDAIDRALRAAIQSLAMPDEAYRARIGLVIPDYLPEAARSALTRAVESKETNVSLIHCGRAAAEAWCRRFQAGAEGMSVLTSVTSGPLVHLHLGLDWWTLRLFDLTIRDHRGAQRLTPLPAHPSAPHPDPLPSYGLTLMHNIAGRSLELSNQKATAGRIWHLVWCTPWMRHTLQGLRGRQTEAFPDFLPIAPHVRRNEFFRQQALQGRQKILTTKIPVGGILENLLPPRPDAIDIRDWLAPMKKYLALHAPSGAIVTGEMAAVLFSGKTLAGIHLETLWPSPRHVMVEGENLDVGVLAQCAAALVGGA